MNSKSLIYSLVGLVTGGAITGLLVINRTQAQTQVSQQNNPTQTQQNSQAPEHNLHHPKGSPTATPSGMSMMSQQQAEQHFIQMMIPHHQGAVDMANLALSKAQRPEIKKLAEAIKTDQNREIEQMKAWYKQWYGTEVPASSGMGMMSMHSGTGMNQQGNQEMSMNACMEMMGMNMKPGTGMMNMNMMGTDLEALKNAPDFDKAFIEQMIPHHKMAVMMATMVLDSDLPEVRNLAKNIIQTQTTEIEQMQQWNQTWFR
ncbi:MAG: DUF305 domain-containing protein [Coleofasciculus sp. S288]|nr:DUF305 domain-containing protein [Coleofasciculus sp. S288]